jgi:RHS repeat-associated protein
VKAQDIYTILFPKNYYLSTPETELKNQGNDITRDAQAAMKDTYKLLGEHFELPDLVTNNNNSDWSHNMDGGVSTYWFHSDHLGSSSYITDKKGNVTQHMEYLPFGETLVEEHLNSNNTPYKFNGKELDDETGNYYYGARYYDPKFSFWLSVDPLADIPENVSFSPYIYVWNNPLRNIDPDGRTAEDVIISGSKPFVEDTLAEMQKLTNNVLDVDENGKVYIVDSGCKNDLPIGTDLLDKLITDDRLELVVEEQLEGKSNMTKFGWAKGYSVLNDDGSAGTGDATINILFNPNKMTGGCTVGGDNCRPAYVGLAHEFKHAMNAYMGVIDGSSSGIWDPDHAKGSRFSSMLTQEEVNVRRFENLIRTEHHQPLRKI